MKVVECALLQVAGILVFCWLCDAAAGRQGSLQTRNSRGGCSRYGHACWGGHGKRSSPPVGPAGPLALLGLRPGRGVQPTESGSGPGLRHGLQGRQGLHSLAGERELEQDAADTVEAVDPQDVPDAADADLVREADDLDAPAAEPSDAGGQRNLQAGSQFRLNGVADFISLPSDQSIKSPDAPDESDGDFHRLRSPSHHRYRNKEKNVQVLIIPDDESQTSDLLHIYQILGRNPRK